MSDDIFLPARAAFPARRGNRVTPLILAAEMFPALERAVVGAERRAFLAFRIFDPATRLRTAEALATGASDWAGLIRHAVERGVTVRLLLTDFEPIIAEDLHSGSWTTFARLRAIAASLPPASRDRLEMIIAQHPGEVGWALRQLARLPVGWSLRRRLAALVDPEAALAVRPGWWPFHRLKNGRPVFRSGPAPRLWPATHHHKFAVIDDSLAIIGGIDVNERRWETRAYRHAAPDSWHDISVQVEGPAAGDAAEHFRRLWNAALPLYRDTAQTWMQGSDRRLTLDPLDAMPEAAPLPPALPDGAARVQMLRTLSRRQRHPFAIGPRPDVRELMAAHRRLILSARRLLYIEAQFFRHGRAAAWVAAAARRSPALQVIILLPQAPDDVAFDGGGSNPAHRHGEWLQARALGRLRRVLGDRLALCSLGRQAAPAPEEREHAADGATAFGSGIIYIHSKLLIADDRLALVSSANINGRSFGWDSEFGLLWEEPEAIRAFRQRLWRQLLGHDLDAPGAEAAAWRNQAADNAVKDPHDRQGFVLPYRFARVRRFGRPAWFVPDDLV